MEAVQRVLALLRLLSQVRRGYTREEVYGRISLYCQVEGRARARLFERDLVELEEAGYLVTRVRMGTAPTLYRIEGTAGRERPTECQRCGTSIQQPRNPGIVRKYCDACRKAVDYEVQKQSRHKKEVNT